LECPSGQVDRLREGFVEGGCSVSSGVVSLAHRVLGGKMLLTRRPCSSRETGFRILATSPVARGCGSLLLSHGMCGEDPIKADSALHLAQGVMWYPERGPSPPKTKAPLLIPGWPDSAVFTLDRLLSSCPALAKLQENRVSAKPETECLRAGHTSYLPV